MSKQAILYARPATDEGAALVQQLETCRKWAQANGYAVVGEYSEVASGIARILPERGKAMAHARKERAVLVCADPTRLSRSLNRYLRCVAGCERRWAPVFFVSEGTSQDTGQLNRVGDFHTVIW